MAERAGFGGLGVVPGLAEGVAVERFPAGQGGGFGEQPLQPGEGGA
jgi:hypothetical protein